MTRLRFPYAAGAFLAVAALGLIFTAGCSRNTYTIPRAGYYRTAEELQEDVRKSFEESSRRQTDAGMQPAPLWTYNALVMRIPEPFPEDNSGNVLSFDKGSANSNSAALPKNAAGSREGTYTLEGTLEEGRFSITATFEREEDIFRRGKEKCTLNLDVTEHMPEGYVNARVILFEDAGCDGTVDLFWGDEIINRKPENESYFRSRIDPKYRRWSKFVGAWE